MKGECLIKEGAVNNNSKQTHHHTVLFLVIFITAIVFSGSLKLHWTNWDDDLYIYKNPVVSEGTLKDIFKKTSDYNMYVPLVITSFALEWRMVKDKPFLYHLDNVLLHLFCTVLVLLFVRRMGLSVWWSGFAALLFGIHPMRVESVVWITERKDLLYALFYLAAMLAYIRYIVCEKNAYLLLTFIFFALSLLSKSQAVVMPFSLILLDWYFKRKISPKAVIEKVIFFMVSLITGLLTLIFTVKKVYVSTDKKAIVNAFSFFEQIILGGYSYMVYIIKSIIPYVNCILYPIPTKLQAEHWLGAAITVVIVASALVVWRKHRFITFGVLFFTFNIFIPMLSFFHNDTAFLHDRYAYVAYIGLFFLMGTSMQQLYYRFPSYRLYISIFAGVIVIVFGTMTIKYIPVWKNSETLWTYVIEKYPHQLAIAHLNRGQYWYQNNQKDKALEDFNMAIEINPDFPIALQNRGLLYLTENDFSNALQDYTRYLELLPSLNIDGTIVDPAVSDVLGNRGLIYFKIGQYEKALADYDLAIKINPSKLDNYFNRAFTCMQLHEYDKAIQNFNLCLKSDPANSDVINNRGVCYLRSGNLKSALDDFNKAILLDGVNTLYYVNRATVYYKLGRFDEARRDLQTAEQMGATIDPSLNKILKRR